LGATDVDGFVPLLGNVAVEQGGRVQPAFGRSIAGYRFAPERLGRVQRIPGLGELARHSRDVQQDLLRCLSHHYFLGVHSISVTTCL